MPAPIADAKWSRSPVMLDFFTNKMVRKEDRHSLYNHCHLATLHCLWKTLKMTLSQT